MYVRFFDVGINTSWNSAAEIIPMGRLHQKQDFLTDRSTIPVVFIENEVFGSLKNKEDVQWLAAKIHTKLFRMAQKHGLNKIEEIQMDCDWSKSTKTKYFEFLNSFKKMIGNTKLSVTLRLHQYKYREKTGIPPADRCMLMYYNMSDLKSIKTKNFILDNEEGLKYIQNTSPYPIPLDFAFPIYSQAVEFSRYDSSYAGLVNMNIRDTSGYEVLKRNMKYGNMTMRENSSSYYYLRFEFVTPSNLRQAATQLQPIINCDTFNISFFNFEEQFYKKIGYEAFHDISSVMAAN